MFVLWMAVWFLTGCGKASGPASASSPQMAVSSSANSADPVQQKLLEYSGSGSTDCGRLNVQASMAQLKTASDCAMQASKEHHAFYVAYDMPGMTVAIAGNSEGKLFSVQAQGTGTARALTSGACPAQLRIASSGRTSCFAPGNMGSMGPGHGSMSMSPGMANPHAVNPHTTGNSSQPDKKQ